MKDGDSRDQRGVAVFSLLSEGFERLSATPSEAHLTQLTDLVLLLDHWAARINLTGHQGPEEIATRLVLDAVALADALPELAQSTSLADLGSGAGFPGLPIAILNPQIRVFLVDSRMKRHHFQKETRRRLSLRNVTPVLGRSEEVVQHPCDLVVAQAMTQPSKALELMAQWSHPGSTLVLPASDTAEKPEPPVGVAEPTLRQYTVPGTAVTRRLWVSRTATP